MKMICPNAKYCHKTLCPHKHEHESTLSCEDGMDKKERDCPVCIPLPSPLEEGSCYDEDARDWKPSPEPQPCPDCGHPNHKGYICLTKNINGCYCECNKVVKPSEPSPTLAEEIPLDERPEIEQRFWALIAALRAFIMLHPEARMEACEQAVKEAVIITRDELRRVVDGTPKAENCYEGNQKAFKAGIKAQYDEAKAYLLKQLGGQGK